MLALNVFAVTNSLYSIILQLEHLAFVKAIAYHYNHYVNRAQRPLIGLVQITTAETRETLKEEHRSLVVVLRLSQDKLFDVWDKYSPTAPKSRTRKRKRPRHHIGDDKVYRERRPISHADDESEDEDFPLTISTPDRGRLASLDEQNETTGNSGMANDGFLTYTINRYPSCRHFGRRNHAGFNVNWHGVRLGQHRSQFYLFFVSNYLKSQSGRRLKGMRPFLNRTSIRTLEGTFLTAPLSNIC